MGQDLGFVGRFGSTMSMGSRLFGFVILGCPGYGLFCGMCLSIRVWWVCGYLVDEMGLVVLVGISFKVILIGNVLK